MRVSGLGHFLRAHQVAEAVAFCDWQNEPFPDSELVRVPIHSYAVRCYRDRATEPIQCYWENSIFSSAGSTRAAPSVKKQLSLEDLNLE